MKRLLILTILVPAFLFTGLIAISQASPFLVCDSYVAPADIPDYFKVSVDGGAEVQSPLWSGTGGTPPQTFTNAIHYDVGSMSVGAHVVNIKACNAPDPIWNMPEACSAATPFSFTRPPSGGVAPSGATGGRLVP